VNGIETRGIFLSQLDGATWPRRGLPHGTLVMVFKIILESVGIEPRTSHTMQSLGKGWVANTPRNGSYYIYVCIYI
jgi:hypothetical protein